MRDLHYDAFVQDLAERRDGRVIENSSSIHAASIFRAFFDHAKSDVSILTGSLSPEVFADVDLVSSARRFVASSKRLRVLIVDFDLFRSRSESERFDRLIQSQSGSDNASFYPLPKLPLAAIGPSMEVVHFAVADGEMFRVETDAETRSAICSFGSPQLAGRLTKVFDLAFEQASHQTREQPAH